MADANKMWSFFQGSEFFHQVSRFSLISTKKNSGRTNFKKAFLMPAWQLVNNLRVSSGKKLG